MKQVTQARLLGRCLAGLLAINLLVVGLSFWTGMSRASVEEQGIAQTIEPAPTPTVAEVPKTAKTEDKKVTVPPKITPPQPPVQAHSPVKAVVATPQIARAAPATKIVPPATPSPTGGETTPKTEPVAKTELAPPAELPASPEPQVENVAVSKTPASPEPPQLAVIRLVNPGDTGGDVHYTVNRTAYTLSPGECHEMPAGAEAPVEFHRGGDFGYAKLPLQPGDYLFSVGDAGWNLAPALLDPVISLRRAY